MCLVAKDLPPSDLFSPPTFEMLADLMNPATMEQAASTDHAPTAGALSNREACRWRPDVPCREAGEVHVLRPLSQMEMLVTAQAYEPAAVAAAEVGGGAGGGGSCGGADRRCACGG